MSSAYKASLHYKKLLSNGNAMAIETFEKEEDYSKQDYKGWPAQLLSVTINLNLNGTRPKYEKLTNTKSAILISSN